MIGKDITLIPGQVWMLDVSSDDDCIWKIVRVNKNLTITPLKITPTWNHGHNYKDLGKTFSATDSVFPQCHWNLHEVFLVKEILNKYEV
jgi:hypothetical protein